MNDQTNVPLKLLVPVMTMERYAKETGLRQQQIKGQVDRGNIPTIKIGAFRLINLVQTSWEVWQSNGAINISVSLMHHIHFSDLTGMTELAAQNQIAKGNLPSQNVGRLKMVDLGELYRLCSQASVTNSQA